MPMRRLGRLASVVPASPTKRISEAESRKKSATELFSPSIALVRTPISPPWVGTRKGDLRHSGVRSTGSCVIVVPRASLLWKPWPMFRIEFGFRERPEDEAAFRTGEKDGGIAGIIRIAQGIDIRRVDVAPPTESGPGPVGQMQRALGIESDAAFLDLIAPHGREKLALKAVVETDVDIVERGFARRMWFPWACSPKRASNGVRCVDAEDLAVVMLMKLIAEHRVGEEIGEIVEKIERGPDREGIDLRQACWHPTAPSVPTAKSARHCRHRSGRASQRGQSERRHAQGFGRSNSTDCHRPCRSRKSHSPRCPGYSGSSRSACAYCRDRSRVHRMYPPRRRGEDRLRRPRSNRCPDSGHSRNSPIVAFTMV